MRKGKSSRLIRFWWKLGFGRLRAFPAHSGEAARGLLCAQPPTRGARGGFSRPFPFWPGTPGSPWKTPELYEKLAEGEAFYRTLFEESPISLWLEDFSAVKKRLSELRKAGITDLRAYLQGHPEFLKESLGLLRVIDVNRATVELYEGKK
jgi:hypothetical protein